MPKTFPIRLEVEEIALGPVLRKLNEMPGIVKLDLDLGHGGQGPGRKQLEHHAAEAGAQNGSREPIALKMLMQGPKHIREISAALGGQKSRAYGLMNSLQKKGLTKSIGKGMHELTQKAKSQFGSVIQAVPALPAPDIKHGPAGRAAPGSGNIVLRSILADGPKSPSEVRAQAAGLGVSPKSITGVMDRAKKAGLIKKNGTGYELTAKGQKIEMGAPANG
jgi:Mn-dependent DtxR family transcriptional regulator